MISEPEKLSLIQAPTPLHRLDRLSEELGIDLWIKRDDLTGFAGGGNKGRKLEYLMPDILAGRAQVVVTCGAIQSNFIRQLGGACSRFGLRCVAAVMELPFSETSGRPPTKGLLASGGNVQLDQLFGVELNLFPDDIWEQLYEEAEALAVQLEGQGLTVYRVPIGGSSALGGYAFYKAAHEIVQQAEPFDYILTSSSSGSTQVGLTVAFKGSKTQVIGICADPEPEVMEDLMRVATELHERVPTISQLAETDFDLRLDYAGEAYGVPSRAGQSAIERLAKCEGILLDPIYTGKAFAGLLDLIQKGEIGGRVLFWHTGGVPSLFALP